MSISVEIAAHAHMALPRTVATYAQLAALTLDTAEYATGDVLADTQEMANAVPANGGSAWIESVVVIDKDDQGAALDLVFMKTNVSLGTENAAVSISDADAAQILGIVSVAANDFVDLGGVRVATLTKGSHPKLNVLIEAASDSRSVFVGAIARDTATYTASGIVLNIGVTSLLP
jgi:hypothetical protein